MGTIYRARQRGAEQPRMPNIYNNKTNRITGALCPYSWDNQNK